MDCTQFGVEDLESLIAVINLLNEDVLQPPSAANASISRSQREALHRRAWDLTNREQLRDLPDSMGIGYLPPRINSNSTLFECIACNESFPAAETMTLECGHPYCRNCTRHMFTVSLSGRFPQCCRERITVAIAGNFLTAELIQRYEAIEFEHNTVNKVYYSNQQCAVFIHPDFVGPEEAFCPACCSATCSQCQSGVHHGDCPEDPLLASVLELGRLNEWQQCLNCNLWSS